MLRRFLQRAHPLHWWLGSGADRTRRRSAVHDAIACQFANPLSGGVGRVRLIVMRANSNASLPDLLEIIEPKTKLAELAEAGRLLKGLDVTVARAR